MDYSRITELLGKYWECETTAEEEAELRDFYRQEGELPEHLAVWKEMFVYQERERQIRLDEDFDRKIWALVQEKKKVNWKRCLQVAALMVLFVGLGHLLVKVENQNKDTCATPEQALAEVREALYFVSTKMNRGEQLVEKNMDEMKVINRYIK